MLKRSTPDSERGAALVEFAIVVPILFLLIFGMMEFGWAFMQHLDARHGAREGARLAAVNYEDPSSSDPQINELVAETCERMDGSARTTVWVEVPSGQPGPARSVGQMAEVRVVHRLDTLTGFLDFAIPDDTELTSTVQIRLEQAATWADTPSEGIPC